MSVDYYQEFIAKRFAPNVSRVFALKHLGDLARPRDLLQAIAHALDAKAAFLVTRGERPGPDYGVPAGFLYSENERLAEDLSVPADSAIIQEVTGGNMPVAKNAVAGDEIDRPFRERGVKALLAVETQVGGRRGILVLSDRRSAEGRPYTLEFSAFERNLLEMIASILPRGGRLPSAPGPVEKREALDDLEELDRWLGRHEPELLEKYGKGRWIAIGRPRGTEDVQVLADAESLQTVRDMVRATFRVPFLYLAVQVGVPPEEMRVPWPPDGDQQGKR